MKLFDTHCHLASKDFAEDLDQVLEQSAAAGVACATVIATQLSDGRKALELSRTKTQVKLFPTLGLHPHDAKGFNADFAQALESEIGDYVAVGETGLDYHYDFSPQDLQKESFDFHIGLSTRVKKPLVIHCRESVEDIYAMLSAHKGAFGDRPGIMHCFSEGWDWGKKFLDLGFYLSFSGILTFKAAENIREAAKNAPLDRILIETDSPYLAPIPFRGKRNTPAYVAKTFEQLCKGRFEEANYVEQKIFENSCRVYGVSF